MAEDPGLINRAARAGAGNEEDNDFQLDLDLDFYFSPSNPASSTEHGCSPQIREKSNEIQDPLSIDPELWPVREERKPRHQSPTSRGAPSESNGDYTVQDVI